MSHVSILTMKRMELFENAAAQCKQLLDKHPDNQAIVSIISQLDYLVAVESGKNPDRTRLKDIVIGILAAREIEPLDMTLAEMLYSADVEARRMEADRVMVLDAARKRQLKKLGKQGQGAWLGHARGKF